MNPPTPGPNYEILSRILKYNQETGLFVWLERDSSLFGGCAAKAAAWNARHAGKQALATKRDGYLCGSIFDVTYFAHRVAWAISNKFWPDGEIDHINGDRMDNRISNLRIASRSMQCRNRSLSLRNKSGVIGVCFISETGKWKAYISHNGAQRSLGFFVTMDEAVAARKKAERECDYHPNHGRQAA